MIHFIYGLEKNFGGKPFSVAHYLAIKSAYMVNKPERIFLYYKYEPEGIWWQKAQEYFTAVKITVPRKIFGNPLHHYAHKADVLRLQILLKYGGVYLDIDTISIKPLTPFFAYDCVMGEEKLNGKPIGLCNAVIIATADNRFLKYWLSAYRNFRAAGMDKYWAEHSVKAPLKIAAFYPNLIYIVPENTFHYPSYTSAGLKMLFEECLSFPDACIHHLWETFSYGKYLSKLTEENIKNVDTTYNLIARQYF